MGRAVKEPPPKDECSWRLFLKALEWRKKMSPGRRRGRESVLKGGILAIGLGLFGEVVVDNQSVFALIHV
jgi:hypothetical protein